MIPILWAACRAHSHQRDVRLLLAIRPDQDVDLGRVGVIGLPHSLSDQGRLASRPVTMGMLSSILMADSVVGQNPMTV